jgi:hypothetical protein
MKPYTRSTKMTTITTPNVQPDTAAPDTEPINLYKLEHALHRQAAATGPAGRATTPTSWI